MTVVAARARQQLTEAGRYLAGHIPANVVVHRAQPVAQFAFPNLLPVFVGGFLELISLYETANRAFRTRNPDAILATGPQFYTFVAGLRLAARYDCPLVLDYRDEWTECPFDFVRAGELDRRWERRCLAAAQLVIFTTESQLAHAIETFDELDEARCTVVPNGWEPRDWTGIPDYEPARPSDDVRVVSFIGNLGNHTPPDDFLQDLEKCLAEHTELRHRLRFRFVGERSRSSADRLAAFPWPELIECVDPVTKSEASRLMRESTALLLMNAPSLHRYIPGKLYEYIAAGPPVVVHGKGGEVGALIERLEAGPVLPIGDTEALAVALESVASGAVTAPSDRDRWLQRHTREANARRMVDLVRPLAENR
jgi:glycosyltransferase involved in cell wall biosynthesis